MLPSINEAWWNSRASYFFIAFFLHPSYHAQIVKVLEFLSDTWCPALFAVREKKLYFDILAEQTKIKEAKIFFERIFQM